MKHWTLVVCMTCLRSSFLLAAEGPPPESSVDRSRLPAALRNVPFERLSSGALMLLDKDGDLVRAPATSSAQQKAETSSANATAAVALDLRVGANIRLGDDPPALPSAMRAQAEPHIARSQTDPDFLVATYQEGRFTDGGAVNCGYSVSRDGGLTWTRSLIPGLTTASGGPYFRASDPVAGIDRSGNIFLNTEGATNANFNGGIILVSRSSDGGNTFAAPVVVYDPRPSSAFPDKPWMAINNFPGTATTGRIVVTFTLFSNINADGAPILRSYSDDGGLTWSPVASINGSSMSQGSQPVFLPGGRLAIVYWNFGSPTSPGERLEVVLSQNGGVTFGAPIRIANATEYNEPSIRTGSFLPSATTDSIGNLYVVYQATLAGAPRIAFTRSSNGGITWTVPIPISDNPTNTGVFNPAIAVSPDGQALTAVFYDRRVNPASTTLVDLFLAQSFDGGASWQPNLRLTSVTTDATRAPLTAAGYMLGDYLGVAESTDVNVPAIPVWVDTRTGDPDPFVTRIGVAPQLDFTSWEAARLSLGQISNPQLGGEGGDADRDGETNLSEFRSQTNPNDPKSVVYSGLPLNLSTRGPVGTGDNALIGGFIVNGGPTAAKSVLMRGIGPSLTSRGVPGALQDPVLELHNGSEVTTNDNWKGAQASEIQATGLAPTDDREAVIERRLATAGYTGVVRGKDNTTGIGLVEIYDLDGTVSPRLGNVSTRGFVGIDANFLIGGLIVGGGLGPNGAGSVRVVVRGIGPTLTQSGVAGALQDPALELHDINGALIGSNENWKDSQQAELELTGLNPRDDRESALITVLGQGNYTVIVRGTNNSTGVGLVEVYNVQ